MSSGTLLDVMEKYKYQIPYFQISPFIFKIKCEAQFLYLYLFYYEEIVFIL